MKNVKSKLLLCVLALVLVVSSITVAAFAASDAELPNATVSVLDPITLTPEEHEYMVWPSGDATVDRPLQVVMNFKANDTVEEARASGWADWKCDFYLTFTGLANGSVDAKGCYLAGNYGDFGWIVIPTDGLVVEDSVSYPVVAAYDANLTYENVCDYVKDFTAALYIAPEILEANPEFTVSLELKMTNPEDSNDKITIGEPAVYEIEDLVGLPDASVSLLDPITLTPEEHKYMAWPNGDTTVDRPLQILMNFKANDTLEEAIAGPWTNWKCDFYLTFSGLKNGTVVADGCYLAGNYGTFGWIVIPVDGLEVEEGVSYPVVSAYDANLIYKDICGSVKDFIAAIYIAPEILEANPDFVVTLELKVTSPLDENHKLNIGEPAVYDVAALTDGKTFADYEEEMKSNEAIKVETEESKIASEANTSAVEEAKETLTQIFKDLGVEVTEELAQEIAVAVPKVDIAVSEVDNGRVVFKVTPNVTVNEQTVKISTFAEPIMFRLPISKNETKSLANVYHETELVGTYTIKTADNGDKYIEVEAKNFSEYSVEPTEAAAVAGIGNTSYTTIDAAIEAAVVGDVITIVGDVNVDAIVAKDGTRLGKSADGKKLLVTDKSIVTFKGASIRYILADGSAKDTNSADIRFSYVFSDEFAFEAGTWGWNYKLGGSDVMSVVAENYDETGRTNLVFANVDFENFGKAIESQIWFKITVDGVEFTVCDDFNTRTVLQVVNGTADYQGAGFEDAKVYATTLREKYNEYLGK